MSGRIGEFLFTLAIVAACVLSATPARAGAVLTYGATSIGVNNEGHLNFLGPGPGGSMTYGVFRAGVGDAISPGCFCEGWGVSGRTMAGANVAGFVNRSIGDGGLVPGGLFGSTTTTATSVVDLSGAPIEVEHRYGPSLAFDVFQAQVRITNEGTTPITDLRYRRVMDWDVPPTEFSELVTHQGVSANLVGSGGNVLFASDNGFATSNPLLPAGSIDPGTTNVDFVDSGPADHGSVFDFSFGTLDPGDTRLFNIFYGSRESEASALSALSMLGVDVYSLGQNSQPGGGTTGTPATFLFAFGGVGGIEPGLTPDEPLLPFVPAPAVFEFPVPPPRRWFDPPFVSGFTFELVGGGTFTEVKAPPASFGYDGSYDIVVPGLGVVGTTGHGDPDPLVPGFDLSPYLTSIFSLVGISPLADAGDPTAFPTFLDFTGTPESLTMSGITSIGAPVPEPGTLALVGLGVAALARRRLWRRPAA